MCHADNINCLGLLFRDLHHWLRYLLEFAFDCNRFSSNRTRYKVVHLGNSLEASRRQVALYKIF